MKVVGIVCSPRLGGNTEVLVTEALDGAKEAGSDVELLTLSGKSIEFCDACYTCRQTGECHVQDDVQEIFRKLQEADGIIIGTPVYFSNVSAQLKTVIDRSSALLKDRKLRGKVGGIVTVTRRMGGANVLSILYTFFAVHGMLSAGGTVGYEGEVPYEKGSVRRDEIAMSTSRAVGRNVVRLLMRLAK